MSERDHIGIDSVDALVRAQRVPLVLTGTQLVDTNPIFPRSRESITLVFVPPYRTRFGDCVMGNPDTNIEFFSPDGKSKGKAVWKIFDGDPQTLRETIENVLTESFPDLKSERKSLYVQIPHPIFG